jgi:phage-related minor tail protein
MNKMSQKTINGIPVSDEVFVKMSLLQERLRRIDAEAKLLMVEKADAEREVKETMAQVEASAKTEEVKPPDTLAKQVAAVTSPAVA